MLKIGDRVRPVDAVGEFIVSSVSGGQVIALDEHGFEHHFTVIEVVKVQSELLSSVTHVPSKTNTDKGKAKGSKPHRKHSKKEVYELDLHAGGLLGSTRGMTNHEIVLAQLDAASKALTDAREGGFSHVVLIHGKGSGKLRAELLAMLKKKERIEFYDAEFRLYKGGATEIKLY